MLAVVEHQQRPAARHRLGHSVKSRRRPGPPDPHPLNQGGKHLFIGAAWHQVDIARQLRPAGITARAGELAGNLPRQPTLLPCSGGNQGRRMPLEAITRYIEALGGRLDRYSGSLTHSQPRDSSCTGRTIWAPDESPSWAMTRSSWR